MRKTISFAFLAIFTLILTLSFVSSVSLSMKDNYEPQETMLISIEGSILEPIALNQVQFKRNNVDVVTDFDIKKIQDKYYIWALAPSNPNNYTLTIKNIYATILGQPNRTDISKNFTVSGNTTIYYVKPGFLSTSQDFKIEVQLNSDLDEIIDVNFPKSQSFIILPGKNIIPFSISSVNDSQLFNLQIGKYTIPVYFQVNKTPETITQTKSIRFMPSILHGAANYLNSYEIRILNTGDKIANLTIEYDSRLFKLDRSSTLNLSRGDEFVFNLTIINNSIHFISGNLVARYDNLSTMLPFEINLSSQNLTLTKNASSTTLFKCAELPGTICSSNEICSGTTLTSSDGPCCTKSCSAQSSGFNYSYIGYFIVLVVLIGLVILAGRYLKAKPNKNLLEKSLGENQQKKK